MDTKNHVLSISLTTILIADFVAPLAPPPSIRPSRLVPPSSSPKPVLTAPRVTPRFPFALLEYSIEEFTDGNCILFGYGSDELENDDDITEALLNSTPCTYWKIDEEGVYHAE